MSRRLHSTHSLPPSSVYRLLLLFSSHLCSLTDLDRHGAPIPEHGLVYLRDRRGSQGLLIESAATPKHGPQHSAARDRTGQDRTGQDRTGQDRTGPILSVWESF